MLKKIQYFLSHSPANEAARFGKTADHVHQMVYALWKYGMYYEEFCLFDCAGKDQEYVSSFITELNRYKIYRKYNDFRDLFLFHDKWRVYQQYRNYYMRDVCPVINHSNRIQFLKFAERHPRFIVKPTNKSCGYGIKIIDTSVMSPEELFVHLVKSGDYLCEELVTPHPITEKLNPTSLNTVRIVTILENSRVRLFYPFLRVGRYGSVVDNGGTGGILIPIDMETGKLNRIGRDELGRYYKEHPDSHISFDNIVLPMWQDAVHLAETLSLIRPQNRCIGWDLAVTPDGWVMIEANIRGQFIGQQMVDRIGKRRELLDSSN